MGRMKLLGAAIAAAALLAACTNEVDFLGLATEEVMQANDRFLEVLSVSPEPDAVGADPNGTIVIAFDKAVDPDSIGELTVVAVRLVGESETPFPLRFPAEFAEGGSEVRITPDTYFENGSNYRLTISNAESASGDQLREAFAWRFTTGEAPAGSVSLSSQNAAALPSYTNGALVDAALSKNDLVGSYYLSGSAFAEADMPGLSWQTYAATATVSIDTSEQGIRHVWYAFKYTAPDTTVRYSTVKTASILYDTVPPVVDAGADVAWRNTAATLTGSVSDENPRDWYLWSGSGVSFGSSGAISTTASGASDGTKTVTFSARDAAGNTGSDTLAFNWDSTPPAAPSVSSAETITLDTTPTWTWTAGAYGGAPYQYKLGSSGTLYSTSDLTYTPAAALANGTHTLYVQQRDASYGYYSAFGSRAIRVTPVIPYDGQTGVSKTPTLSWRGTYHGVTYSIQLLSGKTWTTLETTTATSYTVPAPGLAASTSYTWRLVYTYLSVTRYIPDSGGASFTTRK